ncbi:M13 family metallopeptidase [Flavihumibacter rivuli]|uniref:M13 family metallopeptidase n=1 Tax=Flavihumibacter rivuli TaxID=2838156 RepID=UPI001BDEAC1D|nr:M13 family metallopeptidase [Flavihumibacter rivuli]ULQ56138.1 M13 family metallopeptidase [Flavihumibacter rivuli]
MKHSGKLLVLALAAAGTMGFTPPGGEKPARKRKYIDPANMDMSVKPGDNFYQYANGAWLKANPVPASKTRWGSFDELREESSARLRKLLEEAAAKAGTVPSMQQIGDFYSSGMDSARIEQLGYSPIKADLDRIAALRTVDEMLQEMATQRPLSGPSYFIGMFIGQDRKNVTQYIPQIGQGGTTLPDRDYYLKNDPRSTNIRKEYLANLVKMFQLVGKTEAEATQMADAVMRIETTMAKAQMSRVEMRDPYKTYNKFAWKDLSATTPSINWQQLAEKMLIKGSDSVLVSNPSYLRSVDLLLTALPMSDWKSYMQWHVIRGAAPYLSSAFVNQSFAFNKVLTGQKEQTPRWQRISSLIDGQMGDALGQLYVEKYFKPEAKARMLELVGNLQSTFAERINRLNWMSAETKERALLKLNSFSKKIGYPDKWKDYSSIQIDRNDFMGNIRRSSQWAYMDMVNRLGKPIDKTLWGMTPPTINAYYNPVNNEIAFPAGILQFPFFDFGADDAVNYGGIGAVIGHEMTHGFDDQGSKYAADGNLKDWWTKEDAEKFTKLAGEVVAQYNGYTVLDTIHVNGKLTLGENIADLGGLAMAYEAFTKTKQFKEGKKIDGFTPAQRFFLGWAQVWRNNALPETQAQLILTDSHAPGVHRANGPLTNMDEWYEAFGVKEGDKMYKAKDKRTKIW